MLLCDTLNEIKQFIIRRKIGVWVFLSAQIEVHLHTRE